MGENNLVRMELLSEENFQEHSLDAFVRRQEVKWVYRRKGRKYVLVDMPYVEDWSLEKKRQVAAALSSGEYRGYVALDAEAVVGFLGLKKQLCHGYMILDLLHVSEAYRGQGIGRELFRLGKEEAKQARAKALYISACSSYETVAFYKAMGAALTNHPIPEIAEAEPFDLQMVCSVE